MTAPRLVDVPSNLDAVCTRGPEDAPDDGGLTHADVEAIDGAVRDLYRSRVHPAVSVCLRRHGAVVYNRGYGYARGGAPDDAPGAEKVPLAHDAPHCLFSASKAFMAIALHRLDDDGVLHIDDPVSAWLPSFDRRDKRHVTLRDLLTHRAGLPRVTGSRDELDLLADTAGLVERLAATPTTGRPGSRLAYHALTGGWVIDQVVREATGGASIDDVLRDRLMRPIGLDGVGYGLDVDRRPKRVDNATTGPPLNAGLSFVARRALGVPFDEVATIANDDRFFDAVIPSANLFASAEEACRFFEMMRRGGELDGVRVLEPRTIRRMVTPTSFGELDGTLLLPVRYGVGVMLGARPAGLFGPNSTRAYGHLGFMFNFVWADPARHISCAILTSGKALLGPHLAPTGRLLWTIGRRCRTR